MCINKSQQFSSLGMSMSGFGLGLISDSKQFQFVDQSAISDRVNFFYFNIICIFAFFLWHRPLLSSF